MKKLLILFTIYMLAMPGFQSAKAQGQELQQLILNIEKLSQLRSILDNMYKGYAIISKGYNTVKDLSEGNFNIHKLFLDGLLEVSPTVRKYKRVAEIITMQKTLVKEYKTAFNHFKEISVFDKDDLDYFESVYNNLFDRSLKNLDELLMVITANQLRMNDAERLYAIDRIHRDMQDKIDFLHHFNKNAEVLANQKIKELKEIKALQKLFGIED